MLLLATILVTLSGVFTQKWAVSYPPSRVCAVRGFDATIPCTYSYPQDHKVVQMLWCSMKNSSDAKCMNPPYVYDSNSTAISDFVNAGDNKSDCTLLIRNVQSSYSGEYRFRFITNKPGGLWTGDPGVTLEVTDLKVSLIRISGNETIKQGDSLNLTCDMNCTHSSSEFVWSKNSENLNQSGSVLQFRNLTVDDSGNYTCTWKSNQNSGSDSISLSVQVPSPSPNPDHFPDRSSIWIFVAVGGVIVIVLVVAAVVCCRRNKVRRLEEHDKKSAEKTQVGDNANNTQTKPQLNQVPQIHNTMQKEEVTYATVSITACHSNKGYVNTEDHSVIYSTVQ